MKIRTQNRTLNRLENVFLAHNNDFNLALMPDNYHLSSKNIFFINAMPLTVSNDENSFFLNAKQYQNVKILARFEYQYGDSANLYFNISNFLPNYNFFSGVFITIDGVDNIGNTQLLLEITNVSSYIKSNFPINNQAPIVCFEAKDDLPCDDLGTINSVDFYIKNWYLDIDFLNDNDNFDVGGKCVLKFYLSLWKYGIIHTYKNDGRNVYINVEHPVTGMAWDYILSTA